MKKKSKESIAIRKVKEFLKEQNIQYKFKTRNKLYIDFEATQETKDRARRILIGVQKYQSSCNECLKKTIASCMYFAGNL